MTFLALVVLFLFVAGLVAMVIVACENDPDDWEC